METLQAIVTRRTVPQAAMGEPGPDATQLAQLVAAANAAPDHGVLRPFRLLLVQGEGRAALGRLFAEALLAAEPGTAAAELERQRVGPMRAPLIMVVVLTPVPSAKVPAVEQLACAAAAAQNVLLAAHAQGLAGKWSTGKNAYDPVVKAGLGLLPNEEIVAFIYLGGIAEAYRPQPRPAAPVQVALWP